MSETTISLAAATETVFSHQKSQKNGTNAFSWGLRCFDLMPTGFGRSLVRHLMLPLTPIWNLERLPTGSTGLESVEVSPPLSKHFLLALFPDVYVQ